MRIIKLQCASLRMRSAVGNESEQKKKAPMKVEAQSESENGSESERLSTKEHQQNPVSKFTMRSAVVNESEEVKTKR